MGHRAPDGDMPMTLPPLQVKRGKLAGEFTTTLPVQSNVAPPQQARGKDVQQSGVGPGVVAHVPLGWLVVGVVGNKNVTQREKAIKDKHLGCVAGLGGAPLVLSSLS